MTQRGNGRAQTFFSDADDQLYRDLLAEYAGHIHAREKRTGHFWQGRFGCVAMDEGHLGAALRYVAMNPVWARLVERAVDWRWSSVHALLRPDAGDGLTTTAPVLSRYPDIAGLIAAGEDEALSRTLRRAETINVAVVDRRGSHRS